MALFLLGNFKLTSEEQSAWRIDCASLDDRDWETLAFLIHSRLPAFSYAKGLPYGGVVLAKKLAKYATTNDSDPILLVDSVLTAGSGMDKFKEKLNYPNVIGCVVFAIKQPPSWITPLFLLTPSKSEI